MPDDNNEALALVEVAVEPRTLADQQRMIALLAKMSAEDPFLTVITDQEGQVRLCGRDEFHLDGVLDVLIRTHGLGVLVGGPQVAYRETLGQPADIDHTFKRQTANTGQFARVKIRFEPGQGGTGFMFESAVVGGAVPAEFIPAVRKGLEIARDNGLVAGFPVIDVKATLYDGAYHDQDSSALAFEMAAHLAFHELREKGAPLLLEPVMRVEVTTPDEFLGDVVGDLLSRGGQIEDEHAQESGFLVVAFVPLSNLFGHSATLAALSGGRAAFTRRFDHYAPVPVGARWDDDDPTFRPSMGMRA